MAVAERNQHVIVVGAGIGGMVLALALVQRGFKITVLEQAPALGEVGAGITISPNSDRVLASLGLSEELAKAAHIPERQLTQHWQTGEVIRDMERGPDMVRKYGAGYYHIHRADLHAILVDALEAAAPGVLHLNSSVTHVSQDGRCTLADGREFTGDVVVGADGVRSGVREALFKADAPHFTGQVAWRGLVDASSIPPERQMRLPGIHIGPQRLFMRYPVRGGTLINYAAFVELEGWAEEAWNIPSTRAELSGHFAGWDDGVLALIDATPEDKLFKWALFVRNPLETWVAGKVTLIGDAAHAMLPFMGQGAATAIEDALVLARALDAYPADEALRRYDAARRERTTAIQTNSRLLGLQFQGKDPTAFDKGGIKNEEQLGLFDYDALTVAL